MSRDGAIVVHFHNDIIEYRRKTLSHAPEMCRLPVFFNDQGVWDVGSLGTLKFFAGAGVKPWWTFNTLNLCAYKTLTANVQMLFSFDSSRFQV